MLKTTLEKISSSDKEEQFLLKFDDEKIVYETDKGSTEIIWKDLKSYQIDNDFIYLFLENRQLYDIISASIMDADKFEEFKAVLQKEFELADEN